VEYAHPFLRALAEAEHPEFEPVEEPEDDTVIRHLVGADLSELPDLSYVGAWVHWMDDGGEVIVLQWCSTKGRIVQTNEVRQIAGWWNATNTTVALEQLIGKGEVASCAVELLKSVIAIMADDERRDV
jgi:hypothetical protein